MQPNRSVEVEPDLLLSYSVMRLRRVPLRLPAAEELIIQLGRVARDHDPARQFLQRLKQPDVVGFAVVVPVDARTTPRAREIRWVAIHQVVSRQAVGRQELDRITLDVRSKRRKKVLPAPNDRGISVDSDADAGRLLVQKDCTAAQVCLDVCQVRWKDVDDVLVALALASWIPHGTIIVISGDDVKHFRRARKLAERTKNLKRPGGPPRSRVQMVRRPRQLLRCEARDLPLPLEKVIPPFDLEMARNPISFCEDTGAFLDAPNNLKAGPRYFCENLEIHIWL